MLARLAAIPGLHVSENVPLRELTRFAVGGPARVLADASTEAALAQALAAIRAAGWPYALIGGGTNLIASDDGFPGVLLRYTAAGIRMEGAHVTVESGALLQDLVDASIGRGLRGLETMTGIPGWAGGAVYGNAGAYGRSIHQSIECVRYFDGLEFREIPNAQCDFRYRESVFKANKSWIVTAVILRLARADPAELRTTADKILKIRNEKYPPSLRCAGSIFKNLMLNEIPEPVRLRVPEKVIREGKVPSAYFLELAGAKGLANGPIRVADYHANLIYNSGGGAARQVREMIGFLKRRVWEAYGLRLEEEVQYL